MSNAMLAPKLHIDTRPSQEGLMRIMGPHAPKDDEHGEPMLASHVLSHSMSSTDPENPMNWPLHRKLYTSACAWAFAASVAFGITCFTAGKAPFIQDFGLTGLGLEFIAGMSLYLFGIAFAPIWTPHLTERIGRSLIYLVALPVCALFILGAGLSHSVGGVLACRFLAGLSGGPCLVLIEGTFADIWSAKTTNTYYAFLGTAAYFGAALGPLVGGYLVATTGNWRWTQYITVIVMAVVFVFGLGQSETYQREIPRRQAGHQGKSRKDFVRAQDPAQSGVSFGEMFRITVLDPIRMTFTEPIVALSTLFLLFNFSVVFQWFITVPGALGTPAPNGPGFTIEQVGVAIGTTAMVGATLAAGTSIVIEQIGLGRLLKLSSTADSLSIEYRLVPAMIGQFLVTAALFWIGSTVNPSFKPIVPIVGTAIYVYGNAMVIFSVIPYLFDAYPPAGTLSALTAAASARLLFAGALPLVILEDFTGITPKWALATFGFISIAMWPIPFALFRCGAGWRSTSRYNRIPTMSRHESTEMHRKVDSHDEATTV